MRLRILDGDPDDMAQLQRVLEGAPEYFERTTGHPPGSAEAQSAMISLPPGSDYADKFLWAIEHDETMIGCIEVVRDWPEPGIAIIGLFLIDEAHQRQGLGRAAFDLLTTELRRSSGVRWLRAGVVVTNSPVLEFWHRMGFEETGEVKPYRYDKLISETIILTRAL